MSMLKCPTIIACLSKFVDISIRQLEIDQYTVIEPQTLGRTFLTEPFLFHILRKNCYNSIRVFHLYY